jgi:DNA-binding PadR family transcriptional regulator
MTVGLTWRAEYLLAVLDAEGEVKMSFLRRVGLNHDIRAAIDKLLELDFIEVRMVNKKMRMYKLSDTGKEYIQQVRSIYGSW